MREQFARGVELVGGRQVRWPRTQSFGRRGHGQNLVLTGKYRAAWLGSGPGALESQSRDKVTIGASPSTFPQVGVFGADRDTLIRVTKRMRLFLAGRFGVFLRATTRRIRLKPRRIGISDGMIASSARVLERYIESGQA